MSEFKAYILRRRKLGKGSTVGITAVSKTGLSAVRNDQAIPQDASLLCIRWGCTSTVPQGKVLNSAKAIHQVSNKKQFRKELGDLAPKTWFSIEEWLKTAPLKGDAAMTPVVVRPALHAQGKHCYKCDSVQQVKDAIKKCGNDYYISVYIPKVAEYRVFVAQGRAVWVANKTPADPSAVAWNVAQGGKFDNVRWSDWPLRVVEHAIDSIKISDLDFGGVDIMVGPDGTCYCLEINSAPSQTSPYRQGCVAKVFDYICTTGSKEHMPLGSKGKYLRLIHPALEPKAVL